MCAPSGGARGSIEGLRAETLVGEYRVTLVRDEGERRGDASSGDLVLRRLPEHPANVADEGLYQRIRSVVGSTDVDVSRVGAATEYTPASTDATRPRVDVVVDPGEHVRFLTFGRPPAMLDGNWFELDLVELDSTGFRGPWRSDLLGSGTSGHYCAVRK